MTGELRRRLGPTEAMALSVALMAPTLSASLNGAGIAGLVDASVPLVMLVTMVAIGLIGFSFIRLTQTYNHAGSVYAFTGVTLGPRAGFFAGFALLGVYLAFSGSTLTGTNVFAEAFLDSIGVDVSSGAVWVLISLAAAGGGFALVISDVRAIARALLVIEAISVVLIVVLSVIVLVKVGADGRTMSEAAGGDAVTGSPFTAGTLGFGALASACVLGFFCFAGFEASASLGEETASPRRYIPLAIGVAIVLGGLLFTFAMYAQVVGFGTDEKGIAAYARSGAPIGDLAVFYVGRWMEVLLNLGALLSAYGALLGCVAAAGRLLFAFARDGLGPRHFADVRETTGAPAKAIATALAVGVVALLGLHGLGGVPLSTSYFYLGTIGSLSLLVAYGMTSASAIRLVLRVGGARRAAEVVVHALGIAFVGYVLYKSVYPVPDSPADRFPYIVGAWLLLGLAFAFLSPRATARIGRDLVQDELPRVEAPAGAGGR